MLLLVFAFGLAFLMSLTSSSVWINFPFAISLIVLFRYLSLDYDFRRKSTTATDHGTSRPLAKTKSIELSKPSPDKKSRSTGWRSKVNSPPVEAAFEQFTRHLVTEWVTDLWLKPNIHFQYEVNAKGSSPSEILGTTYQTNLKPALKALASAK
ncbi:sorting nexin-16 [Hordeum vulgare]|nr:sorting nexin-16 [Hordeum vulgare]